jgi:hypothetical protein
MVQIGWRHLTKHYKGQIIACDVFTIDTFWLKTLYVFFFIELGSRRVHLAGITANPNSTWVTQDVRQPVWKLEETDTNLRFLIHDRDSKLSCCFRLETLYRARFTRRTYAYQNNPIQDSVAMLMQLSLVLSRRGLCRVRDLRKSAR